MLVINEEIKSLFSDPSTVKILASVSREGVLHAVPKGSLSLNEEGNIVYWELLESSTTNRNLIYSLWYEKQVAVTLVGKEGKSFQIKGIPVKTLVSGKEYEKAYVRAQERNPENDLAAVYIIEPQEVIEESYPVRKKEEEAKHPLYIHLDRLVRQEE